MAIIQDQIFWQLSKNITKSLKKDLKCDIAIIGGGMAGLSAAQALASKGLKVVLLEKSFCGSGATGKSSGFITQDSEFSLHELIHRYGQNTARELWQFATTGVDFIRNNIKNYSIDCDMLDADCLVVANSENEFKKQIQPEHDARFELNYKSQLFDNKDIITAIGSDKYSGGVNYTDTFGINPFAYANRIKNILMDLSIKIYEETPVVQISGNKIQTQYATLTTDKIILCCDHYTPDISPLKKEIYHAQTFLLVSSPLTDKEVLKIFPAGNKMVWDTDLLYQYYRITGDNRLLLGGSTLFYTYAKYAHHDSVYVYNKLTKYFKDKFPELNINFEYMWPGLIGITKDIMPILGADKDNSHLYYIAGTAGLPWAAALGQYMADFIFGNKKEIDHIFDPYRKFPVSNTLQNFLGKKLSFAISNFMSVSSF